MSFDAKNETVRDRQLKIQEITVRAADAQIYTDNSGTAEISIGEEVAEVVSVIFHDDSGPTLASKAAADASIAGTGNTEIHVASTTLAANDYLIVKYIVAE